MKNLLLVLLAVVFGIYNLSAQTDTLITGQVDRTILQEQPALNAWYTTNYNEYKYKVKLVKKLQAIDLSTLQVQIVMGTWCSDSRREVPRVYKILDAIAFNQANVTLIFVDKKKQAPNGLVADLNIQYVPTIIFYNANGTELGRIIETPKKSLEKDMYQILK